MRETWMGSGIYSTDKDRRIYCDACLNEWDEVVYFNDYGVAEESYICPSCHEYVHYFEDLREEDYDG